MYALCRSLHAHEHSNNETQEEHDHAHEAAHPKYANLAILTGFVLILILEQLVVACEKSAAGHAHGGGVRLDKQGSPDSQEPLETSLFLPSYGLCAPFVASTGTSDGNLSI